MEIPLTEANATLADLVRRAEAGEDIVLTRHGRPAARLIAAAPRTPSPAERKAVIDSVLARAALRPKPAVDAARAADFLYGEDGMPK